MKSRNEIEKQIKDCKLYRNKILVSMAKRQKYERSGGIDYAAIAYKQTIIDALEWVLEKPRGA